MSSARRRFQRAQAKKRMLSPEVIAAKKERACPDCDYVQTVTFIGEMPLVHTSHGPFCPRFKTISDKLVFRPGPRS